MWLDRVETDEQVSAQRFGDQYSSVCPVLLAGSWRKPSLSSRRNSESIEDRDLWGTSRGVIIHFRTDHMRHDSDTREVMNDRTRSLAEVAYR